MVSKRSNSSLASRGARSVCSRKCSRRKSDGACTRTLRVLRGVLLGPGKVTRWRFAVDWAAKGAASTATNTAANTKVGSRRAAKKANLQARGGLDRVMVEMDRLDSKEAYSIVIALCNEKLCNKKTG